MRKDWWRVRLISVSLLKYGSIKLKMMFMVSASYMSDKQMIDCCKNHQFVLSEAVWRRTFLWEKSVFKICPLIWCITKVLCLACVDTKGLWILFIEIIVSITILSFMIMVPNVPFCYVIGSYGCPITGVQ